MKKITFLFALLCASVMLNAKQYCDEPLTLSGGAEIQLSCISPSAGTYQIIIKGTNLNGLGGSFYNPGAVDLRTKVTTSTSTLIVCDIEAESAPSLYTPLYVMCSGEQNISWPSDIEWGVCGDAKTDPALSINETAVTLSAEAPAETFQIEATKADGAGAISYESSNAGIASVDANGLVTAVGRGTATITVRVAANETFAAASKKLTVTVTGPINWEGVDWLSGSDKYKVMVDPEIDSKFGGIKKQGDDLYVGFPSAAFGDMSIVPSGGAGAWKTFALSNFPRQLNQFTVVCQGVTYTFDVFYTDGEPEDLTGFNLAKGKPVAAGHSSSPANQANDGKLNTRWGSDGASHYATVGDAAEDWWYVDLGDYYVIDSIRIWFETACPTDYDLLISNNGAGWTVIGTYKEAPKTGDTADKANVYTFTDKVGRYLKIFARNGYNNLLYGISIWEFEAYGKRGSIGDVTPPVMVSAELSGTPEWNKVKIAVSATDEEDGVVTSFHVVDNTKGIDQTLEAEEGIITVTGLAGETVYNFIVSALDVAGNESANTIVVENVTTPIDETIPQTAAPVPTRAAANVRPIYCDAYESILAHDFDKNGFAGAPLMQEKDFSGDKCLVYDIALYVEITWGMYDDGNRAIIAQPEYRATDKMGVDASGMDSLHLDIFSSVAMSNIEIRICDNLLSRINVTGEGWQSFDIDLANPLEALANINNVRWFKFTNLKTQNRQKITFDNVYFYKKATIVPTSIDNTVEAVKALKVVENGQLIIIKNGIRYNVAGQVVK